MSEHHKNKTRAVEGLDQVRRSRPAQHAQELRASGGAQKGRHAESAIKADGPPESRRSEEPRHVNLRARDDDAFVKSEDLVDEEAGRRGWGQDRDDVASTLLQGLLVREAAERRAHDGRESEGPTLFNDRREPKQQEAKPRLFGAASGTTAASTSQALRDRETRDSGRDDEFRAREGRGQQSQGAQARDLQPQGTRVARPTEGPRRASASREDERSRVPGPGKAPELPKAPGLKGPERRRVEQWYRSLSPTDRKWYADYVERQAPENREEALSYARRIDDGAVKDPQERRQLRGHVLDELMKSDLRPEQQRHLGKMVLTDENPNRKREALERNGFGTKPGVGSPPGSRPGETLDQLTRRPGAFDTRSNSVFLSTALLPKNAPKEALQETVRHELGHLRADEALTGNQPRSRDRQLQFGLELNRNYSHKVRTPEARAQAERQLTNLYRPHTSSPREAREKAAHALENRDEYYASLRSLRELYRDHPVRARAVRQFDPATSMLMRREERGTLTTDERFLRGMTVDGLSKRYGIPKDELERFRGYQNDAGKASRLETYLTQRIGTTTGSYETGTFASGGSTVPRERNAAQRRDNPVPLASHGTATDPDRSDRRVDGNDGASRTGSGNTNTNTNTSRPPAPPITGGDDGGGSPSTGAGSATNPNHFPSGYGSGSADGSGSPSGGSGTSASDTGGTGSSYDPGYSSNDSDSGSSYSSLGSSFPSNLDSTSFGTLGDFLKQAGISLSDLRELLPPGMDVADLDLNSDGKITGSDIRLLQRLVQEYGAGAGDWTPMSSLLGQISTGRAEAAPGSLAAAFSGAAVRRLAGGAMQEGASRPASAPNPAAPLREAGLAAPPTPPGNPAGSGAPRDNGGPLSPLRVALFREAHGSLENIANGRGGPEGLWLVNALAQDRDGRAGVTDAFESMVTGRNGPEKMMKLLDHAASSPDQSLAMASTLRDMAEAAPDRAVGIMLLTMDARGGTESVGRLFPALTREPKGAIATAEFLDATSRDPNSSRGLWEMMDTLTTPTDDPARGQRLASSLSRSSEWVQGSQALTRTFGTLFEMDDGGARFATLMSRMSETPGGARDTGRMLSNMVFDREGGTQVARMMARSTRSRTGARQIAETLERAASAKDGALAVSRTFLGMAHSKEGARVLASLARDSSTAAPLLSLLNRLEASPAAAARFSRALDQMAADRRVRTEVNVFRGRAAATPELQAALNRLWQPREAAVPRASAPVPLSWGGALAMERAGLAPRRESTGASRVTEPAAAPGVARSAEAPQDDRAGSGAGRQQGHPSPGGRTSAAPTEPGEAPVPTVVRTAAPVTVTPTVPVRIDWPAEADVEAAAAASDERKAEAVRRPGDQVLRLSDPDCRPGPRDRRVAEAGSSTASTTEAASVARGARTGADLPLFAARTDSTAPDQQKPESTPFRPGDYYSEDTLRSLRICPECGFRTSSAGVCARCVSNACREGRIAMAVPGPRAV